MRMMKGIHIRTSNYLLLVVVLMIGLLFCSFIASVDYKLRNNDFIYSNSDKSLYTRHKFNTRKFVSVRNLSNCMVILSDSVGIEVLNEDRNKFDFLVGTDTISINNSGRSMNRVLLYLPSGTTLFANSSAITVKGSFDFKNQASYEVALTDSELSVSSGDSHTFFEDLKVSGFGRSHLTIGSFAHIQNLNVIDISDVRLAKGWQVENLRSSFRDGTEMLKQGDSLSIAPIR